MNSKFEGICIDLKKYFIKCVHINLTFGRQRARQIYENLQNENFLI